MMTTAFVQRTIEFAQLLTASFGVIVGFAGLRESYALAHLSLQAHLGKTRLLVARIRLRREVHRLVVHLIMVMAAIAALSTTQLSVDIFDRLIMWMISMLMIVDWWLDRFDRQLVDVSEDHPAPSRPS